MKAPNPVPTEVRALCSLLHSLSAPGSLPLGLQLHAHILKSHPTPLPASLTNHLISFYSRCRLPFSSLLAFRLCPSPPLSTWSSLLSSLSRNSLPHLSLLHFLLLLRSPSSPLPGRHTLPVVLRSCAALPSPPAARSLHSLSFKLSLHSDVFVGSALVDAYAKFGWIEDARKVFDEMPERNVVTWSGLINGYAQLGLYKDALGVFRMAPCSNDYTYTTAVRACTEATLMEVGCQVHGRCVRSGFDSSPFVGSSLVSLYSKCGVVEDAYKVFDEVAEKNVGLWNAMIIACAQHGHAKNVFGYFRQMRDSGIDPNFITFLCLLYACSHTGLVEEGKKYFELMGCYGIVAGPQHYACMVDLLSRAGKLQEAVDFIARMPIEPPDSVWAALLTGCRIHKDVVTAAYAASRLHQSGTRSSGALTLICNAYAAAGRYAEAAETRMVMRDKGVRKETGMSWVEFDSQIHTFVCGDQLHPKSEAMYRKLEEVEKEMRRVGYLPEKGEDKRRNSGWHSERLAVVFMLVSLKESDGRPIRVMKNLRVCGDCHSWLKFLTMCIGRTVVLRDNNRFHRFQGGVCSCGDYW